MSIKFCWDENKAESNRSKHGVIFDEAKTVFYDDNATMTTQKMKTDLLSLE